MIRKWLQVRHSVFIAALTLVSLVSPIGTGSSPAQRNSTTPSRLPTVDPTPIYSITWTATGAGFTDATNSGRRSVQNQQVVMAGSAIYRMYADGLQFDTVPYNLTVTDDFDQVDTVSCSHGGVLREHHVHNITDPNRYTGGPNMGISWITPLQRPDGSWYMHNPFHFEYDQGLSAMIFSYRYGSDYTDCNGSTGAGSETGISQVLFNLMDPGDLEGDAQGKVFTKRTQFVNGSTNLPLAVQWNVTVRLLDGHDLTVDRLEVTQGLQDKANTLPLVQGRRTVVRAYIGIGQDQVPVPFVTGKLSGYVGSTLLGRVPAFNRPGYIVAPVDPSATWQHIDDTLNFQLPYAWTLLPALRLEVEVNPDHSVAEANYNNNKLDTSVALLPCGGVSVAYLPIHYTPPGGFSPADPSTNISGGAEFMRKIYPVSKSGLKYFMYPYFELSLTSNINISGADDFTLELLEKQLSSGLADHIFAWLPSLAYQYNGVGNTPGVAAFGNDTENPNLWRRTFAHEIGHNYGLEHSGLTTDGAHWFDVYERVIKPASVGGTDLYDVMVPQKPESDAWISPVNYKYLVGQICSAGAAAAAAITQSPAAADTLLVTGILSNTTPATGSLEPLYHFTTVPTYTLPVGSQACVNLRNAANTLLSQYCFNQGFSGDSGTPAAAMPFGMVVPYPQGLNRVELVQSTTLLDSRVASPNSPTVTVTFPNAAGLTLSGHQAITWTGSDVDGDPLTYNILYSRDNGATWVGIASGITGSTYNLNFSKLAGTMGASGKIKVMVSDGFDSAEGISANPFTIANKPPVAEIISPPSGAAFTTGPKVVLEGAGMDLEDASLGDSALSWMSSLDGALGAGQLLEASLSPGVHTITLTATDSGGLTSTASIQITVVQPTPLQHLFLPTIKR